MPSWAQEVVAPIPGIEATISEQMDAFLDRDVETAFGYASPMIRGLFRTPEIFGSMVEQGYPMVWTPSGVEFGDLREVNGALVQRVIVTDRAGRLHALDYKMLETADGWRIDGVQILQQPGVAA